MSSIYEIRPEVPRRPRGLLERIRMEIMSKDNWRRLRPGGELRSLPDALRQTRQRLFAMEARQKLADANRTPRGSLEFRSQCGEDSLIWELLDGQLDGIYVEVGAFDGVHYSVSSVLDAMGWEGLLVEAIPDRAAECARNRPHAKVEHAALCGEATPGTVEFTITADCYGGMLSYSGALGGQDQAPVSAERRRVSVPTTSMNALLERHFPGRRLDVAVIDVEGAEIGLLKGFDLERWAPRVMIIEDNSLGRSEALPTAMAAAPYVLAGWLTVNRIYVHKDQSALRAKLGV